MIRNFLRKFMSGRYGPDHLNVAMVVFALIIHFLYIILSFSPLVYVSYAILALTVFRMLSRNITRRRAENDRFIRYWWPVRTRIVRTFEKLKHSRTHKFLRCQGCRNTLRVPRGKGKIQITCPKCGERFIRKT